MYAFGPGDRLRRPFGSSLDYARDDMLGLAMTGVGELCRMKGQIAASLDFAFGSSHSSR